MGKKYIIEIPDDKIGDFIGSTHFLMPYLMEGHIGHHDTGLPIEPYTEPDLERVKTDAYKDGYKAGREAGIKDGKCETWEAARKIWKYDTTTLKAIFGAGIMRMDWFMNFTASEVIEKLKAYEQGAEIRVGDVVRVKNAPEVEIWVTGISDEDGGLLSGLALKKVDDNCNMGDTYANRNIYNFERTGKHYDVPTVLEKMRGEQDERSM